MPLANTYTVIYGQLPEVFQKLAAGQAPTQFTTQHLKDLGYASSNYRAVIPLLKAIGFLSPDGVPTQRYHDYRNSARSRLVMAEALREAYSDLFVIKANPTDTDKPLIEGKFKSAHNASDHVSKLMANTFFSLLSLADMNSPVSVQPPITEIENHAQSGDQTQKAPVHSPTLHYNIQIHLPATKDIEVYNAIFKSLKEHLLD